MEKLKALMEELKKSLKSCEWEAANTKTMTIIRTIYNDKNCTYKNQGDTLFSADFQNFPCEYIREIDLFWRMYSNNKFGISVQKDIYKKVQDRSGGNPLVYSEDKIVVLETFSIEVGWTLDGRLENRAISFDNLETAPDGYLPFWNDDMIRDFGYLGLFCRMEVCELEGLTK